MKLERSRLSEHEVRQHEGLDSNLRFLIHEVHKQLERTLEFLAEPVVEKLEGFLTKDDYIDNLKNFILRKCFALVARTPEDDQPTLEFLRAVDVVATNLERIADFCENIIDQTRHLHGRVLPSDDYGPYFEQIVGGVDRVEEAILRRSIPAAVEICRAEHVTDQLYSKSFDRVLKELERGQHTQSLVATIFIYRYLERMGDSLLNIGEAALSACLGDRIKMDQFRSLEGLLDSGQGVEGPLDELAFEPMAETRSGCKIGRLHGKGPDAGSGSVIFKEGRLNKLRLEREGASRWHRVMPGLAPEVRAFHDHGDNASILFEYLPGHTFEEYLVRGDSGGTRHALSKLCRVLDEIWTTTRVEEGTAPRFVEQLSKRVDDVYALHPSFRNSVQDIGALSVPPFDRLLQALKPLDARLTCPFSVLIHGDFNVDNVIYNASLDRLHFIDLHRSRNGDWAQDVSVFLVSNHRLQVFEEPVRRKINRVILEFFNFVRERARSYGDPTFEARLALGLVRSFATSTRFVLDEDFAKGMFLRSRFLVEQLLATRTEELERFEIAQEVLVD